jgi:Xaa-Pro aminopeptidase
MKRGLVVLDPAEIPEQEWRERVTALQRRLAADGIDVGLVYGDVSRSDDIAYLTNLCIYWNEGILAVPADGEPVFLTKLSPRVFPWMRLVSTLTEIRSGRNFGELAAKQFGAGAGGTVALLDGGLWPASVAEELRDALAGWEVVEAGALAREPRLVPTDHELALLRRGAGLLAATVADASGDGLRASARIAAAERGLRGAGFLDVFATATDAPDGVTSLQVTGQYRYLWLHASRLADDGQAAWPAALRQAADAAVAAARAGVSAAQLTEAARPALDALPAGATTGVRWVHQADMATGGEYASYPADLPLPPGSAVVITVAAAFRDGRHAAVADTVLVGPDGAERITTTPGTEVPR